MFRSIEVELTLNVRISTMANLKIEFQEHLSRPGVQNAAGLFCRVQGAGCRLKFNYNWKTAGTKNN